MGHLQKKKKKKVGIVCASYILNMRVNMDGSNAMGTEVKWEGIGAHMCGHWPSSACLWASCAPCE